MSIFSIRLASCEPRRPSISTAFIRDITIRAARRRSRETLEARAEFLNTFAPAIVRNSRHYYAIPHEGSQTPPALFEKVMADYHLSVRPCRPEWMDFGFIDKCYEVDEQIYDPDILRDMLSSRIQALNIPFEQRAFTPDMRPEYDYVVWATYGLGPGAVSSRA